jgi:nitrous-oxide reductase
MKNLFKIAALTGFVAVTGLQSCKPKDTANAVSGDAGIKAYVAPGKYDEVL